VKTRLYSLLSLEARACGLQAWRLWDKQGGAHAALRRLPPTRLALAARARAEHWSRIAEFHEALSAVFPLGLSWSHRRFFWPATHHATGPLSFFHLTL